MAAHIHERTSDNTPEIPSLTASTFAMPKSETTIAYKWLSDARELPSSEVVRSISLARNALQIGIDGHDALLVAKAKYLLAKIARSFDVDFDGRPLISDALRDFARLGASDEFRDSALLASKFATDAGFYRAAKTLLATAIEATNTRPYFLADLQLSELLIRMGQFDSVHPLLMRAVTECASASAHAALASMHVLCALYSSGESSYVKVFRPPALLADKENHLAAASRALAEAFSHSMNARTRLSCLLLYPVISTLRRDPAGAADAFARAERYSQELPKRWWFRYCAHTKGICARLNGDAASSVVQNQLAIAESIDQGDLHMLRISHFELALAYECLGDFNQAFASMKHYAAVDATLNVRAAHHFGELTWMDAIRELVPDGAETRRTEPAILQNAIRLISTMNGQISVLQITKQLGLSRRKLEQLFREWRGTTPVGYVRQYLLDIASAKLKTEGTRVSVLAYELGFSSPCVFSRLFRKRFGCSPRDYAKRG